MNKQARDDFNAAPVQLPGVGIPTGEFETPTLPLSVFPNVHDVQACTSGTAVVRNYFSTSRPRSTRLDLEVEVEVKLKPSTRKKTFRQRSRDSAAATS